MLRRLLLCCLALLLASCFDVREEYWIDSDGGGRARLQYTVPSEAILVAGGRQELEAQIHHLFDAEPAIQLDHLDFETHGPDTRLNLQASTDSMFSLLDLKESEAFHDLPKASADFVGTFEVKVRGLDIDARRTIDFRHVVGLAALAIGSEQRNERQVLYIFHLPTPALEHNAPQTADGGRTLIWKYPLGDTLAHPIVTEFRSRLPLPWWAWTLLIVLPLALFASIAAWLRRRLTRKPRAG